MKVLVVGSGGREHALCWAIAKSPLCTKLFCAPGNAGISSVATLVPVKANDLQGILSFCQSEAIGFVVIGPEEPLTLGLADLLRQNNIPCFGPGRAAARLEGSKVFMKELCTAAGVPTADFARFDNPEDAKAYVLEKGAPIVVKADGLAAGKGVTVAQTIDEALNAIDTIMTDKVFGESGNHVVIEEYMVGEEVSFFALCHGEYALSLASAQDHKAVFDGDKGPNTGGMGAYSPAPVMTTEVEQQVIAEIILPTLKEMVKRGTPFEGVLFAGLMITAKGPRLIEFNVRFGDPETEAILPRLKSDFLAILWALSKGLGGNIMANFYDRAAVSVVMASKGYPGTYQNGTLISGLEKASSIPNTLIFHAGTELKNNQIVANGGRVLAVTAYAENFLKAQEAAYKAIDTVEWPEGFCRRDIGWRAIERLKKAV